LLPWKEIGRAKGPGGELVLRRRGDEFSLRIGGDELMNSRRHHSEDVLAVEGCAGLRTTPRARVLIGGLGMGFTARAALDVLGPDARLEIAELVPEVVAWNRGELGALAGRPLDDRRVVLVDGDVANPIAAARGAYHAILIDVDNGPGAFTAPGNAALYAQRGLDATRRALAPGGAFAVWSTEDDKGFTARLRARGFTVQFHNVPALATGGGRHVVWVARAPATATATRGG
jgi:spermidine synthase